MFCGMWQYIASIFFKKSKRTCADCFVRGARSAAALRAQAENVEPAGGETAVLPTRHGHGRMAPVRAPRLGARRPRVRRPRPRRQARWRCVPRTAGSLPIRPRHKAKANSIWRPRGRGDLSVINFFLCARPSHAGRTDPAREGCHVVAFAKPGPFAR